MSVYDLRAARAKAFHRLTDGVLDILVIGGGIVGAGVARDAAMRGLRTGLVEQYDFAFGTSSRSSRLLHGGLRYLAQGRLRLVYQASREKRILHQLAPHLAQPLAFVFPSYRGSGWPLWKLRLGVRLYDGLCGGQNFGPSRTMTAAEVLGHLPGLEPKGLCGAVRYFDGLTSDARLVLDTLRSAASHGAAVANYTRCHEAARDGTLWRCVLHDEVAGQELIARSPVVVNATGPWASSFPASRLRLRLTKGIHLVVPHDRLPVPDAVVMADQGRILFAIPWGRRVILGTTDTDYDGPLEAVRAEPEDIQYVLGVVNRAFPVAGLSSADVRGSWAGLRPLVDRGRGHPSDISRAHQIHMPQPGWVDVAGGKLTTYRLIAQEVVDRVVRFLGYRALPCATAVVPLLASEGVGPASGILPPPLQREVVEELCRHQWAVHLDDVMVRRTSWLYAEDDPAAAARQVAAWMAEFFGWDEPTLQAELARCHDTGTADVRQGP